jgi:glycosyltransferase involved in cell wall biosynthesis
MRVSVIVCTFNRCQILAGTLDKLAKSIVPAPTEWEVLIVDNNSSDATSEVAKDFCRQYPNRFRYVFEGRPGKSYALNSGIQEARGDVLAFVDDDVSMDPVWLRNLTADLCSGDWAGAGGRILPEWSCAPPSWFPEEGWLGRAPLGIFDLGLEARQLTDAPFGGNMAFRRRLFEKHGGFRTSLGPGPNNKVRNNEDTEFGRRLLAAGERLKYEPTALVYHPVPPERLQKRYFLTWWFNKGRADTREAGLSANTNRIGLHLLRRLAAGTFRWVTALGPSQRFAYRLTVWLVAGSIVESYRQSRQVKQQGCEDGPKDQGQRTKNGSQIMTRPSNS